MAAWLAGVVFTLLKGIHSDPWGLGIFDLDLITLLIGYLFLYFGHIHAAAFAVGQGLLMDIFSSGPAGLSALIYLVVFLGIYLGSLFFNFQTVKGQIIIILLAVFLKNATGQGVTALLFGNSDFSRSIFCARAVSIIGTGLLTPVLYAIFDRLGRGPGQKEEASALEVLRDPPWEEDRY